MPKTHIFIMAALAASLMLGLPALAQKKPHDPGNCFHWKGCRGDSIGAMWYYDPDRCKAQGGQSWMDDYGQCHNLPDGRQVVRIPSGQ